MAANIPSGVAIIRASAVSNSVLIIDGSIDTFSELYSHANSDGVRWGTPFTTMYTTINPRTNMVKNAARLVIRNTAKEPGCLRYVFSLLLKSVFIISYPPFF